MDVMDSDGQWVPMGGCQGNLTKRGRLSRDLGDEKGGCREHVSEEHSKQRKVQKQGAALWTALTCSRKGEKADGGWDVRSGGAQDRGVGAEAGGGHVTDPTGVVGCGVHSK